MLKTMTTAFALGLVLTIPFGSAFGEEALPFKPGLRILPGASAGVTPLQKIDAQQETSRSFVSESDPVITSGVDKPVTRAVSVTPLKAEVVKTYPLKLKVTTRVRKKSKRSSRLHRIASRSFKSRSVRVPTPMLIGVYR